MLDYNRISDYEKKIYNCCDKDPEGDPPAGDCCYDTWSRDLVKVTAKWKHASVIADNKQSEYSLVLEWKDKLKVWYEDWEAADEKADAICRQVERFIHHLLKVCNVTDKTTKAIEILFCMIEDLYKRVDHLKEEYDELMKCLKCLNRPELNLEPCFGKSIEDYGKKLEAVIGTRDVLIQNVVMALELAYGLHIQICEEYGLKMVLEYWKEKINCAGKDCDDDPAEETGGNGKKCHLHPKMTFPIDQDKYYKNLKNEYESTKQNVEDLKKELDKAKEKRDALQACKDSLKKAIEEVDPKNKCKQS